MIYDVGDRVEVSTVVEDDTGAPVNTPTVTVLVTKPSGATVTPSVTNTGSAGLYRAPVDTDEAGVWSVLWTASGTVVATDPSQFTVRAPTIYVVSLEELKDQLRRTDDSDDLTLRGYLASATAYVQKRIGGPVSVKTFTERRWVDGVSIIPFYRPLVSVTSITYDGGTVISSGSYIANTSVNSIDFISAVSPGWTTVVYRAGLAAPEENVKLSGMIIAQHLWDTMNGGGGRRDQEYVQTGLGFAIPRRAAQMLEPDEMSGIA